MKDGLEKFFKEDKDSQIINRKKQTPKFTEEVIEYIYNYEQEFYLLICCSKGTRFEHFIEELALIETEYTKKYLKNIDDEIKGLPKLTEDFIHIVSRSFF